MLPLTMRKENCTPIVEMLQITKRFPGVVANDSVSFSARRGELHALVGENGAGKSTLMNILYGLHRPDSGEIRIAGEPVEITNPGVAISLGIGMVHQHFMLVRAFTGVENIILGDEPSRLGLTDYRRARNEIQEICQQFQLVVDLDSRVGSLSVSAQQKVEILKALYRGVRILILDEPTSVLAPQEVENLFAMLRKLTSQGTCVILISHKLPEVMAYSDRITVLRQGRTVANIETSQASVEEIAKLMVGSSSDMPAQPSPPVVAKEGRVLLSVRELCVRTKNRGVGPLSFDLHEGEILGIAGVDGNGQRELVEALVGLRKASGSCLLANRELICLDTRHRLDTGIAYIPEDRFDAMIPSRPILDNAILGLQKVKPFSKHGILDYKSARNHTHVIINELGIRSTGPSMIAGHLSGGNQQKLVLGRALSANPKLLIACQPTRGLDTHGVQDIHRRILAARERGTGVLLVSYDLDELVALCDRILVMFKGKTAGIVSRGEATRETIGALMLGAKV